MEATRSFLAGAVLASLLVPAGPASADLVKCHAAIAKNATKYQATMMKIATGCHKARSSGSESLATDCSDVNGGGDLKGKQAGAFTKLQAGIDKACSLPDDLAVLDLYPRCPTPADAVDNAGGSGIDTFAELETCLAALSEAYVGQISDSALGEPSQILSSDERKCQGGLGKAVGKLMKATAKSRSKCQSTAEKGADNLVDYAACATGDPDGKITPARDALVSAISASCSLSATDLIHIGLCGQSVPQLQECVSDRVAEPLADGMAALGSELPGTCPGFANVTVNAGTGQQQTSTSLQFGYSGYGFHEDLNDRFVTAVKLEGCNGDCEECAVKLDPTPADVYAGFSTCRCATNPTIACTTIEASDAACPSSGTCNCFFGPPLPINAAGVPLCMMNYITQELGGTTHSAGSYDVTMTNSRRMFLGIHQLQPCPICSDPPGAPIEEPNDGVRDGVCVGGARNGLTCDMNAGNYNFGDTSYDCTPSLASNITGAGLRFAINLSDSAQAKTAAIPSGTGGCTGGQPCHCSQCSGNSTIGCSSNADCTPFAAGNCTYNLVSTRQNSCTTITQCTDTGGNNGECVGGPSDQYCNGVFRADGSPILTCATNSDCDSNDCNGDNVASAGECGQCDPSLTLLRECFLPTITAIGSPGVFTTEGVGTFCAAATANSGVNGAFGLPGPGRMKLDMDLDLYCPDGTTPFELPSGSNCP